MVTVTRPSRARVRKCNDTTPRCAVPNSAATGAGGSARRLDVSSLPPFGWTYPLGGSGSFFFGRPLAGAVSAARRDRRLSPEVLKSIRRKLGIPDPCAGCSCGRAKPVAPVCRGPHSPGHSRSHVAACADGSETAFWREPRSDRIAHGRLWASSGHRARTGTHTGMAHTRAADGAERAIPRPAADARLACRSSPCGRVAGRWPAQPATIADRTTRTPASRGDSQSRS
jgi:hypothetical protein